MAEVVGLIASIATLAQLASEAAGYVIAAKGATTERKRLREEIRACGFFLQKLQDELEDADEGNLWSETVAHLSGTDAPLGQLQTALTVIKAKLGPKKGLKKAIAVLKWPFDESEVAKITLAIERQKSLLQLALSNDSRKVVREIRQTSVDNEKKVQELKEMLNVIHLSQNDTNQYNLDEERQKILSWLSSLDYWTIYEQNLRRRQDGTGHWMLQHPTFVDWLEGKTKVLWCPGIPGAGKSVMASFVKSYLRTIKTTQKIATCIIAFDYKTQQSTTLEEYLLSLVRQILEHDRSDHISLTSLARELYRKRQAGMRSMEMSDVKALLEELAPLYDTIYLIMDALDECHDDFQEVIIHTIREMPFRNLQLLCTSRPLPRIRKIFRRDASIEIIAKPEDIKKFVQGQIQNIARLRDHIRDNPSLKDKIVTEVSKKAEGMFLLARFHMDSLATKSSPNAIRNALEALPATLSSTYAKSMHRIFSQSKDDAELARIILVWVTLAYRPLKMRELQHAIVAMTMRGEAGQKTMVSEDELDSPDTILSVCAGLIEAFNVDADPDAHVRLVHYTAQQYLKKALRDEFPTADADVAISFENGFSSWTSILRLLADDAKLSASNQALFASEQFSDYSNYGQHPTAYCKALHLVSYFGLADALVPLLKTGQTPDIRDSWGRTPLWWAVHSGHLAVVILLLAREDVDVNAKDEDGQTPLIKAAQNDQTHVLKALLSRRGVKLDWKDVDGQSALMHAVKNGNLGITQLLLQSGANADLTDMYGRTVLSWAAESGYLDTVSLLLTKGADINCADVDGHTPLWWAAESNQVRIVDRLLKEKAINVNARDNRLCQTPLLWAARKGHARIVEKLLERQGVDADSNDSLGRTPLSWAAQKGHSTIVKLLLKTGKVNVDRKDSWGRSPLSYATEDGNQEVLKLLKKAGLGAS